MRVNAMLFPSPLLRGASPSRGKPQYRLFRQPRNGLSRTRHALSSRGCAKDLAGWRNVLPDRFSHRMAGAAFLPPPYDHGFILFFLRPVGFVILVVCKEFKFLALSRSIKLLGFLRVGIIIFIPVNGGYAGEIHDL